MQKSEDINNQRLKERALLLYKASRLAIPINVVNGAIVFFVFWQVASDFYIITWTAALTVVSIVRIIISYYVIENFEHLDIQFGLKIFTVGTTLTGLIWGSLVFAIPIHGDTALYFSCVVFMLAGMTAGATSSSAAYLPAGLTFNIPALLALFTVFMMDGNTISYVMALVTVIYGLLITQFGTSAAKRTRELLHQKHIVETQSTDIKNQQTLMQEVLNTIGPGVAVYDENFNLTYWNQSLLTLMHIPHDWPDETKTMEDFIRLLAENGEYGDDEVEKIVKTRLDRLNAGGPVEPHRYDRERPDGRRVEIIGNPMKNGGMVTTYTDITDQHRHIEEIKYIADHDSLTGLVNRSVFQQQIENAIAQAKRTGALVSVYYLDLDHFKDVNDTLGHPTGDELLIAVARRIQETIRDTDTVARLGGDEFAVIGTNQKNIGDCVRLADRILKTLGEPYELTEATIQSGASIGVTLYPYDDSSPVEIASHADVALYKAKQSGRNKFAIFDDEMNKELLDRKAVEQDLVTAFENEEFVLFYQSQVDLESGTTIGAEALIRWNHPTRGLLTPANFLEVSEKARIISRITIWVIREAVAFLSRMRAAGHTDFRLSINLSADDFRNEELCDIIASTLKEYDVLANMFTIEITESMMITDLTAAIKMVQQLKEMGVTVAIDDFGVGYSSMSYLKDFAADVLKIDYIFIKDCLEGSENSRIVEGIINLGQSLEMTIVAEGIEEAGQAELLKKMGCETGQGYLFSKPVPEKEFIASLKT
tara:strand:+ start:817 stop:3108 length:2292 start_codon:yes stop_codon:yes gene_type:complete